MISMECHLLCVILCTIQVYNKRVLAKKEKRRRIRIKETRITGMVGDRGFDEELPAY